ncbi:hypothetical protein K431DRAFT_224699 [Polychaeton citri CBS 116435]|uniref:Allergen n=1 Tax=Polychaeton citri CBS 116435 TaxID=1314669 RepID=A0A9P4Q7K8_9PEZI|nr:hypothetical protein K431DRAFT_224699 [Polychaeton citri CBS 116435]
MEAAKARVKDFVSNHGKTHTTVEETVNPAVTNETVKRTQHDNVQTAIDKEVHQDHYHTSVQPVKDREVLPTQHHHKEAAIEHKSFEHDNAESTRARIQDEAAQFKNTSQRVESEHTAGAEPIVGGEHHHHHVHETIQPVVQKETLEPHVVHTTVPVHETHHNAAQHHSASALPAMTVDEFTKQGGSLAGRETRYDEFDGEPRNVGATLKQQFHPKN